MMLDLVYKIELEKAIIKEVVTTMWKYIKATKSLRPIVSMLNPKAIYDLDDGKGLRQGNYYKYIKDLYNGYELSKGA